MLAAVETVNSKMPATIDAACLCKMADRGQIKHGIVDGPLAFDNAISKEAATTKGIRSDVAGDPDILLVPDLEAGNILAKQLSFLANADSAGLVLGARVPIILTSRADSVRARIASCAVAMLAAHARRKVASPRRCRRATTTIDRMRIRIDGVRVGAGDQMDDFALVLNAGSSSLKFCVYRRRRRARGGSSARARSKASARRRACRRRTAAGTRIVDEPLDATGPGRRAAHRFAGRVAPLAATAGRAWSASATASCTAAPVSPDRQSSVERCSTSCVR